MLLKLIIIVQKIITPDKIVTNDCFCANIFKITSSQFPKMLSVWPDLKIFFIHLCKLWVLFLVYKLHVSICLFRLLCFILSDGRWSHSWSRGYGEGHDPGADARLPGEQLCPLWLHWWSWKLLAHHRLSTFNSSLYL